MYEEVRGKAGGRVVRQDAHREWDFLRMEGGESQRMCVPPASFDRNAGELARHQQQQQQSVMTPRAALPEEVRFHRVKNDVTGRSAELNSAVHKEAMDRDPHAFHFKRLSRNDESASSFLGLSHKYRVHHVDRGRTLVEDCDRVGQYYTPESCFSTPKQRKHGERSKCLSDTLVSPKGTGSLVPSLDLSRQQRERHSPRILRHSFSAREGNLATMLNQAEAVLGGEHAEVQPEDLLLTARSISTSRLYDLVMQATAHAKTRQNSQTSGGLKKFMVNGAVSDTARSSLVRTGSAQDVVQATSATLLHETVTPRRKSLWKGAFQSIKERRLQEKLQKEREEEEAKTKSELVVAATVAPSTPSAERRRSLGKPPLSPSVRRPHTATTSGSPILSSARDLARCRGAHVPAASLVDEYPTLADFQGLPASCYEDEDMAGPTSPPQQQSGSILSRVKSIAEVEAAAGGQRTSIDSRRSRPSMEIDTQHTVISPSSDQEKSTSPQTGLNGTPEQKKHKHLQRSPSGHPTPSTPSQGSGVPRKRTNPRQTMVRVVSPGEKTAGLVPGPPPPP